MVAISHDESIDIDKYGNKIPVEVSTSKIRLKGEDLAVGVIRDIRERKVFEEKIKDSENTLSGIITAAPIGINLFKDRIWIWSNKGRPVLARRGLGVCIVMVARLWCKRRVQGLHMGKMR